MLCMIDGFGYSRPPHNEICSQFLGRGPTTKIILHSIKAYRWSFHAFLRVPQLLLQFSQPKYSLSDCTFSDRRPPL